MKKETAAQVNSWIAPLRDEMEENSDHELFEWKNHSPLAVLAYRLADEAESAFEVIQGKVTGADLLAHLLHVNGIVKLLLQVIEEEMEEEIEEEHDQA